MIHSVRFRRRSLGYLHEHPDGNTYVLGSDRNNGLWIFETPTPWCDQQLMTRPLAGPSSGRSALISIGRSLDAVAVNIGSGEDAVDTATVRRIVGGVFALEGLAAELGVSIDRRQVAKVERGVPAVASTAIWNVESTEGERRRQRRLLCSRQPERFSDTKTPS
jgi:hypothetical protein